MTSENTFHSRYADLLAAEVHEAGGDIERLNELINQITHSLAFVIFLTGCYCHRLNKDKTAKQHAEFFLQTYSKLLRKLIDEGGPAP